MISTDGYISRTTRQMSAIPTSFGRFARPPSTLNQSLRLGILLLLFHKPPNAPVNALLQRPQRLVPQNPLGLVDVVVARHGRHHGPQLGKGRRLADEPKEDLARRAEEEAHAP